MEESLEQLTAAFKGRLDTKGLDLRTYSPLALAFIGDGIYDLIIRTMIVGAANTSNQKLHQRTKRFVNAKTQSAMADIIAPLLTEEEHAVYKRGRNAKTASMAKHATVRDYKHATGFEALMGYLYLSGQQERLLQLVAAGLNGLDTLEHKE